MSYDQDIWPKIRRKGESLITWLTRTDNDIEEFVNLVRRHSDIPEPELIVLTTKVHRYCVGTAREIRELLRELRPGREYEEKGGD